MAPETPKPWPPDTEPPLEQLAEWLRVCTPAERLDYVEAARHAFRAAGRCAEQGHDSRLAECQRYRRLGQVVPGV